ncbi:MAG TPA: hypothetical protein VFF21_09950 [Flavobacteriaceae bacterium]|nr:hypothetical protein [Flavobacteriaceae bacterium]
MKKWINPFEKYSESRLISFGLAFYVIGSLMAYFFHTRFDNFLHMVAVETIEIHQPFIDNLIILVCLFIVFFVFGKLVYQKTRAVDILALVLTGNAPFYLMSLSNINDLSLKSTDAILTAMESGAATDISGFALAYLSIVGIVSIAVLIWNIALLYNGFKTAANAKGAKAVLLFIIAIILSITITYFIPNTY